MRYRHWSRRESARRTAVVAVALLASCIASCGGSREVGDDSEWLSAYGLWEGNPRDQRPAEGVIYYELATPLFSDHAEKLRFVKLPQGTSAVYASDDVFSFPVGTVIAKSFGFEDDSGSLHLLETRILEHLDEGWVGRPYVWNDEQSDARLELAGGSFDVGKWLPSAARTGDGEPHTYLVPNANQCKACHRTRGRTMLPIGPRAAQLNWELAYEDGRENQLERWSRLGALDREVDVAAAPSYPHWDVPTSGTVDERARAWLEINCAHCHNPQGAARTSSLDLRVANTDPTTLGVFKSPVAAGRGSGNRLFSVVPGEPDRSILLYRLESLDPGVMMPELGRSLVDHQAVDLIRSWIDEMENPFPERGRGSNELAAAGG